MLTQDQLSAAIAAAVTKAVYDVLGQMGALAPATAVPVPAAPAAPIASPAPAPAVGITYSIINGARVDDIVPPNTPGTVTLPVTRHVLSLPQPNPAAPKDGEMLAGYVARVWRQCGGEQLEADQIFASLVSGGSAGLFAKFGPFDWQGTYWPHAADYYYNPTAYMTDEERAAETARAAAWEDYNAKLKASLQAQQDAAKAEQKAGQAGQPTGGRGLRAKAAAAKAAKAANDVPLASPPGAPVDTPVQ